MATVTLTSPTDGTRYAPGFNTAQSVSFAATCSAAATACVFVNDRGTTVATGSSSDGGLHWTATANVTHGSWGFVARATIAGNPVDSPQAIITITESTVAAVSTVSLNFENGWSGWTEVADNPAWLDNWPVGESAESGSRGNLWRGAADDGPANETWPGWDMTPAAYRTANGLAADATVTHPPPQGGGPRNVILSGAGDKLNGENVCRMTIKKGDHLEATPTGNSNFLSWYDWPTSTYPANCAYTPLRNQPRSASYLPDGSALYREQYFWCALKLEAGTTYGSTYVAALELHGAGYNGSSEFRYNGALYIFSPGYTKFFLDNDRICLKVTGSREGGDGWTKSLTNGHQGDGWNRQFYLNTDGVAGGDAVGILDNHGGGTNPTPEIQQVWTALPKGQWICMLLRFYYSQGPLDPLSYVAGEQAGLVEGWIDVGNTKQYNHWFGPSRCPTAICRADNGAGQPAAPGAAGNPLPTGLYYSMGWYRHQAVAADYTMTIGPLKRAATARLVLPAGATFGPATAQTPSPPTNASPPTIAGTATRGQSLGAAVGVWAGAPSSYAFQWQRDTAGNGTFANIGGATGQNYVLAAADVGNAVRVAVVASNAAGASDPAYSAPTALVAAPPPAIGKTTVGSNWNTGGAGFLEVSGPYVMPEDGTCAKLTAYLRPHATTAQKMRGVIYNDNGGVPGTLVAVTAETTVAAGGADGWVDFTFAAAANLAGGSSYWLGYWYGNSVVQEAYEPITGGGKYKPATYSTLDAPPAWSGTSGSSNRYAVYAPYTAGAVAPANVAAPTVTGSVQVGGGGLTSDNGTWTASPTSYTYQWQVADDGAGTNAANIDGQTSATFQVTAGYVDKYLRCQVTAHNAAGNSQAASSAWRGPVVAAPVSGGDRQVGGSRPLQDGSHARPLQDATHVRVVGGARTLP